MKNTREIAFETEWFSIEREFFDNIESLQGKPFYRLKSPDGVIIYAMTAMKEIILVRQFRPALNRHTLEFPSGFVDEREYPEQAAARELYEETGYTCKSMNFLAEGNLMASRTDSRQFAFFAQDAVRDPDFSPKEDIEVNLVDGSEFKALVTSGQFEQFTALAVILLAKWKLGSSV